MVVKELTLCFTLAHHTLHTYGLFLFVKVCAFAACSPPGSVYLYWISFYVQDEMAFHLHLILCTLDTVTICTPVTLFFPLVVWLCLKKIQSYDHHIRIFARPHLTL